MSILERWIRPSSVALALLAGCAPIRYSSQDVVLRHRIESDTLEVLILYDGIQAERQEAGKDGVDVASRFTGRVALGKREFMLCSWPLHLDLEKVVEELARIDPGTKDPWSAWQREGLEHLERIHVVASGLYAGQENRISLYQRIRVEGWSRIVEWLDRSLRMYIAESNANGSLEKDMPLLDAKTRSAWVELAKTKTRWLTFVDGGIEVKLPMSPEDAARILAKFVEEGSKDPISATFFAALTTGIGEVEIASGHIRVAWKAKDGMVQFHFAGPKEYDERLAKEMSSWKDFPPMLPAREDVIRLFRGD